MVKYAKRSIMESYMENYSFFALAFRMKYINRWGLMRSLTQENLLEHSAQCAMLAHALAKIGNKYFNKGYDCEKISLFALYHDMSEIYTGDLPTPVKYFNSSIRDSYKSLEKNALETALSKLPEDLVPDYRELLDFEENDEARIVVKAADKLCAYIKCLDEYKNGNLEFKEALNTTQKSLENMCKECRELCYFMEHFIPAFEKSLDEL